MSGRDHDPSLSGEAARRQILARRARFVALALGTSGIAACDSPRPCLDVAQTAVVPGVCLEVTVGPTSSAASSTGTEAGDAGAPEAADAGDVPDAGDAGDGDGGPPPDASTAPDASAPRPCLGPRPCLSPPRPCLKVKPSVCLDY